MKKKENLITFIIVMVIVLLVVIAFILWYKTSKFDTDTKSDEPKEAISAEGTPDGDGDYIDEVRYIGGIGYPEVYDVPFEKNDFYVSNKELWEINSEIPDKCVAAAEEFAGKMFNIKNDETSRIQSLKMCMDQEWFYEEDFEGNGYLIDEYIQKWNDYVVDNDISMESSFVTDSSLVCENGLLYVRGILEYEVFSSTDARLVVKDGKQTVMMEIMMHRAMENMSEYDVVGFMIVDTDAEAEKGEDISVSSVSGMISAGACKIVN